jgi:hypothetical protein
VPPAAGRRPQRRRTWWRSASTAWILSASIVCPRRRTGRDNPYPTHSINVPATRKKTPWYVPSWRPVVSAAMGHGQTKVQKNMIGVVLSWFDLELLRFVKRRSTSDTVSYQN